MVFYCLSVRRYVCRNNFNLISFYGHGCILYCRYIIYTGLLGAEIISAPFLRGFTGRDAGDRRSMYWRYVYVADKCKSSHFLL